MDHKRIGKCLFLYICYPVAIRCHPFAIPSFSYPLTVFSSGPLETPWPTSSVTPSHPQSVFRSQTCNLQPVSNLLPVTHNMIPVPHRILGNYLYFGIAKFFLVGSQSTCRSTRSCPSSPTSQTSTLSGLSR